MEKAPKVGDRVRYPGGPVVGPCTGTVTRIYVTKLYPEDFDWESNETPPVIGIAPEREWSVAVKVDARPTPWAYGAMDTFAPDVADLQPA